MHCQFLGLQILWGFNLQHAAEMNYMFVVLKAVDRYDEQGDRMFTDRYYNSFTTFEFYQIFPLKHR